MLKYLPILNLCLIILLAVGIHLNYSFSSQSLEEVKDIKQKTEIYLEAIPKSGGDTIVVNINNFYPKK